MKKIVAFILFLAMMLSMSSFSYGATYITSYDTQLPNYDMNNVNGYCCGPTAGAEMLAYWDRYYGKDNLWEPDSDIGIVSTGGIRLIQHLLTDFGTTSNVGTTPGGFAAGIQKHCRGLCGNPAPTNGAIANYTAATATLYQKSSGVTLDTTWNTIKTEINANRPVAVYIGHYPRKYNSTTLYQWYNYHWQLIYGYDETGGAKTVYTRTGFGQYVYPFDLGVYWNYSNRFGSIDNIAIVTLSSL